MVHVRGEPPYDGGEGVARAVAAKTPMHRRDASLNTMMLEILGEIACAVKERQERLPCADMNTV